jgi:Tfp pilus assembly protein PilP
MPAASQLQRGAAAKPDPFLPFVETEPVVKKKSEQGQGKKEVVKKLPVSPLQQREIRQFRLVGIAGDERKRMAMVEDGAAKKVYPLVVGTYIGPNDGRVAEILPDRVIIEEPSDEPAKRGVQPPKRRIVMTLHREE